MKAGGEGRKAFSPPDHMTAFGQSASDALSTKVGGASRRLIATPDSIAVQKAEMEEVYKGDMEPQSSYHGISSGRQGGEGMKQIITPDHLNDMGSGYPTAEPHIGGSRRKHTNPRDHMVSHGTAHDTD